MIKAFYDNRVLMLDAVLSEFETMIYQHLFNTFNVMCMIVFEFETTIYQHLLNTFNVICMIVLEFETMIYHRFNLSTRDEKKLTFLSFCIRNLNERLKHETWILVCSSKSACASEMVSNLIVLDKSVKSILVHMTTYFNNYIHTRLFILQIMVNITISIHISHI